MEILTVDVDLKNVPILDTMFTPMAQWNKAYLAEATEPFIIAVSSKNHCKVFRTKLRRTSQSFYADRYYATQTIKSMLWIYGGHKVSITGDMDLYNHLAEVFSRTGARAFDVKFMEKIYDQHFTIELVPAPPQEYMPAKFLPRHLNGYRLGLDVGGADHKVTAVANGKVVYQEEILWQPLDHDSSDYHYTHMMNAMITAAKKIPRIDAIGVSTAGIVRNNKLKVSAIFRNLAVEGEGNDIFLRMAKALGCSQLHVENDGDVTALAGSMNLDSNSVLGISMSTSQATGYIDRKGNLTHWLNELAFVPINANPEAPEDSWSEDRGCGVSYFSQEAVLRLAKKAGFRLSEKEDDSQKLRTIQMRAEQGNSSAINIFRTIGCYLGHTLAYYHEIYKFQYVLLLGRVMSGAGGDAIFSAAQKVLTEEYTDIAEKIAINLPLEEKRSISQGLAAASLPEC